MSQRRIANIVTTPPPAPGFVGEGHLAVLVVSPDEFTGNDPFILLADDRLDLPAGRPAGGPHPHAGFETVTFMLEGSIHDRDEGVLEAGDVQWMTAGRGIIHGESMVPHGHTRLLQLWLTLPRSQRAAAPGFRNIRRDSVPVRREAGVEVRVYAGSLGDHRAPANPYVPVTLADIRLAPHATLEQDLPSSYNGFLYVLDGSIRAGTDEAPIEAGQVGWLDRPQSTGSSTLRIAGGASGARLVLYAGEPQGDPLTLHGPFVADSREDIVRLYREYREGRFQRLSETGVSA
ncbi:MAG TPA: pirin-like C-terminal cupin domain-containing protein [Candidatus Eisenbacteria bacterium]|nr:pirin-like C-terminal cupin domain-containing protein [Candidatus Eisenbacteria bacterium]